MDGRPIPITRDPKPHLISTSHIRAAKPNHAYADAPFCALDEGFFKAAREPEGRLRFVLRLV